MSYFNIFIRLLRYRNIVFAMTYRSKYLNSRFHDFLAISHVSHAEFAEFLVQEPALALPQATLTIDDT